MKKIQEIGNVRPEISELTEEEIKLAKKKFKDKYDIFIPKSDAIKIIKLTKELAWWLRVEQEEVLSQSIIEEIAIKLRNAARNNTGEEISMAEAYRNAQSLLTSLPNTEKKRIANEIKTILIPQREVLRNPVIEEKAARLLRLHYDVELTNSKLEQLIPYLSRKLWFAEGLDASLEKCLDDLLVYAEKRKRKKRVKGVRPHDKFRQAIDSMIKKIKVAGEDFEPLYQGQN